MAIPLQQGQFSCRELVEGEVILEDIPSNQPIMVDKMDTPYARNEKMREKLCHADLMLILEKKDSYLSQKNN